ncbi:hypothetical protein SK128_006083 [Halocaridina rubra]|uniref:Uncharacterized protein n=1 Tax=Halocaridina rubra TaxID=373956 RepID=A0AAN8XJ05_HALRR
MRHLTEFPKDKAFFSTLLLRLVQEVIHTSASCLYELFASIYEMGWMANPHNQSQEAGPNLTVLLQHAPVEGWLSYSVPQLLVLCQPERGESSGSEACLTHQYCSVISTLLQHSPRALHYCTTHFAEELRYYVQESVVSCRLPASSPIRPHTMKVIRTLAEIVMPKTSARQR